MSSKTEQMKGDGHMHPRPVSNPRKTPGPKPSFLMKNLPVAPNGEKSSRNFQGAATTTSASKLEVKRVKLEAKRKLGEKKILYDKQTPGTSSKTLSLKTFREVVQGDSVSQSNSSNITNQMELESCLQNEDRYIQNNNQQCAYHPKRIDSEDDRRSSSMTSNMLRAQSQSEDLPPSPLTGPSQSDLDHWDMVAEACAGVLQKLDLKCKTEDNNSLNHEDNDILDLSTDFEFEDWALSYSVAQKNEWDDSDDDGDESTDGDWMYLTDIGVQCSLSEEDGINKN